MVDQIALCWLELKLYDEACLEWVIRQLNYVQGFELPSAKASVGLLSFYERAIRLPAQKLDCKQIPTCRYATYGVRQHVAATNKRNNILMHVNNGCATAALEKLVPSGTCQYL